MQRERDRAFGCNSIDDNNDQEFMVPNGFCKGVCSTTILVFWCSYTPGGLHRCVRLVSLAVKILSVGIRRNKYDIKLL